MLNTALLCGGTCAISLPLGTAMAWLVARTDLPGRRVVGMLLGLMLFVPLYVQAAAWQAALGVQGWFALSYGASGWLQGWGGAIWVHGLAAVPWVALVVGMGLRLIEPELEEQALLDGSPWQVFLHVTLRSTWPAVAVGAIWVAITTAGEMTVTDLFAVRTYAEELYTRTAIGPEPGDPPLALLPGTLLTIALVAAGLLVCAKLAPRDRPLSLQRCWVFRLGRWRLPLTLAVAMLLMVLVGVPLASLCYKAGLVVTQVGAERLRSWSPVKCLHIVGCAPWEYRRQFGASVLIASLAATAAVAAAIPIAWLARRGQMRTLPALAITALGLALPGPVIGLAIIGLLNRPALPPLVWLYDQSILAPWLALTIRGLPLAILILWHALRTLPQELLDAALLDGASPVTRLLRVALPNRLAAVALAWVVALAVGLADLGASVLVVPPGVVTLSIEVFQLLHGGVEDQVAAICLAMLVVFAVVAAGAGIALRRMLRWQV